MGKFLLTHDLGTSSDKAALYALDGTLIAHSEQSYPVYYAKGGLCAEQDAEDWWQAFCLNNQVLLRGRDPREIAAVAISGQMMACLPVDRQGKPLRRCMIWADGRAKEECAYIASTVGEKAFYSITGNNPGANYTAPKILYLKRHEPHIFEATYKYLQPKDYINFRLTGRYLTDASDAGHTHLYDIFQNQWSDTLMHAVGLSFEKLPDVVWAGTPIGNVLNAASGQCCLYPGTLVVQGAGDGRAAMLGAGILEKGEAYVCLGTSSWFSAATDKLNMDPDSGLYKGLSLKKGYYINGGTMQAGGLSYDWYAKNLWGNTSIENGADLPYADVDRQVQSSSPGANGLLYMPYILGERAPWFDTELKGAFLGLKATHTKEDLSRSVMEGVALHLGIILDRVEKLDKVDSVRIVGGGAKSFVWQQILADVFQKPIIKTNVDLNAGSLGTAVLAGVGAGLFPGVSVVKNFHQVESIREPVPKLGERYAALRSILEEAYQSLRSVNKKLTNWAEMPGKE